MHQRTLLPIPGEMHQQKQLLQRHQLEAVQLMSHYLLILKKMLLVKWLTSVWDLQQQRCIPL